MDSIVHYTNPIHGPLFWWFHSRLSAKNILIFVLRIQILHASHLVFGTEAETSGDPTGSISLYLGFEMEKSKSVLKIFEHCHELQSNPWVFWWLRNQPGSCRPGGFKLEGAACLVDRSEMGFQWMFLVPLSIQPLAKRRYGPQTLGIMTCCSQTLGYAVWRSGSKPRPSGVISSMAGWKIPINGGLKIGKSPTSMVHLPAMELMTETSTTWKTYDGGLSGWPWPPDPLLVGPARNSSGMQCWWMAVMKRCQQRNCGAESHPLVMTKAMVMAHL